MTDITTVDARTAFEANYRKRWGQLDFSWQVIGGYRPEWANDRWRGWEDCWNARVGPLVFAFDQMNGPLSTAALVARADTAEATIATLQSQVASLRGALEAYYSAYGDYRFAPEDSWEKGDASGRLEDAHAAARSTLAALEQKETGDE